MPDVAGGAVRCGGVNVEAVWLRGCRHRGEPPVEDRELLRQGREDGNVLRGESAHDGARHVAAHALGLLDEAAHGGRLGVWAASALRVRGVVEGRMAKDLLVDGLERVSRIGVDVVRVVRDEDRRRGGVGGGDLIGLATSQTVDIGTVAAEPSEHVIK